MGYSPDVLVTALQRLEEGQTTFDLYHPAFDKIIERKNRKTLKNPYCEFGLVPVGPGSITDVGRNPLATIRGGRRQGSARANTYATTFIYAYDVPTEDLRDASTEEDLVGLIRKYPMRGKLDFVEQLAEQLVMGNVTPLAGFPTLNADATYNPKGLGARNGLLDMRDPLAQTRNAHGIARNSVMNWHNQYGDISSFASDGRRILRKVYYDCSQQGGSASGDVDLIIADRGTFDNYVDNLEQFTFRDERNVSGDPGVAGFRQGVPFMNGGCMMFAEPHINIANFTTAAAQNGIAYLMHTATWHLYSRGTNEKTTKGFFANRKPFRLPTQDVYRYEMVLSLGLYCDELRRNGVVTGGAQL